MFAVPNISADAMCNKMEDHAVGYHVILIPLPPFLSFSLHLTPDTPQQAILATGEYGDRDGSVMSERGADVRRERSVVS
jgi:hypothetical protein